MPERRMILAHLTVVHPPADVRIYLRECRALAAAGFRVILLAPAPAPGEARPAPPVEFRPLPRFRRRLPRMLFAALAMPFLALRARADCYHFHDPELIPAGLLLKLLGRRVIWDVHEHLAGQMLSKPYLRPWARGILSRLATVLEAVAARSFDAAVCATPAIAHRLVLRGARAHTVQNHPLVEEWFDSRPVPEAPARRDVVYVGGLNPPRGVAQMVQAMGYLPAGLDCRLRLVGPFGPAELWEQCARWPGWKRVDYLGILPRSAAMAVLRRAAAGLVVFQPQANHLESQPNKLFEYMSAGLPLVASDFPLWRELIEGHGLGLNVDPTDPEAIAEAITWLLTHPEAAAAMGARGNRLVREQWNWEREAPTLLRVVAGVLAGGRS